MTQRAALWAAVVGACCGVLGGAAAGWCLTRDAGRGRGAEGTLRGDLDRVEAATLGARAETAATLASLAERIAALERGREGGGPASGDVASALRALTSDLATLRDAVVRDLGYADRRIADLEHRVDELLALIALQAPAGAQPQGNDEDEAVWVNIAQDPDPLRRFSALAMLGHARTDRSVRASLEGLHDPEEIVVWQAARNLGEFREAAAARDLAGLLRRDSVALRTAGLEALRLLGAPDTGFDPTAQPADRNGPAEILERWAAEHL